MKLLSVRCQHCGAPLQVGDTARFVTCQFCRTELTVERTESAIFTQKLEEIHEQTSQMAESLEVIRLQNELEKLDREWAMERETFMVTGKDGHRSEPGAFSSILGGIAAAVFGIGWIIITSQGGAPGFFPLFGAVVAGIGVISAFVGVSKASGLEQARSRYEQQRRQQLQRLNQAKSS